MKTINGINYVFGKPGVAEGSCEGCIARGNRSLCEQLLDEQLLDDLCTEQSAVWDIAPPDAAERAAFEAACCARLDQWREVGNSNADNGVPSTPESLCWKDAAGNYGVHALNAAWWGWRAARGLGS